MYALAAAMPFSSFWPLDAIALGAHLPPSGIWDNNLVALRRVLDD